MPVHEPVLSDASQFPSEEIIFSHIGRTKPLWISLFEQIHTDHPDFAGEWRYYRDGKSWLMKVTQKKKTVFWLSIIKDSFRTTFYLPDKAEDVLLSSGLSDERKEEFRNRDRSKKLNGLTVAYRSKKDIEDAAVLIGIKLRMK